MTSNGVTPKRKVVTWIPFVLTLIGTILCFASGPTAIVWQIILTLMTFSPIVMTLSSLYRRAPQIGLPIGATIYASFNVLIVFLVAFFGTTVVSQADKNCGHSDDDENSAPGNCGKMKVWIAGIWIVFFMQIFTIICASLEIKRISASNSTATYTQANQDQFPPSVAPMYFGQPGVPQQANPYPVQGQPYGAPVYPMATVYPNQYPQAFPQPAQQQAHQPPVVQLEDA